MLSGTRDDGAAGLQAIRTADGSALVQDPDDAASSVPTFRRIIHERLALTARMRVKAQTLAQVHVESVLSTPCCGTSARRDRSTSRVQAGVTGPADPTPDARRRGRIVRAVRQGLETHPDERSSLFDTVLVNVTSFLRDANAWELLADEGALAAARAATYTEADVAGVEPLLRGRYLERLEPTPFSTATQRLRKPIMRDLRRGWMRARTGTGWAMVTACR